MAADMSAATLAAKQEIWGELHGSRGHKGHEPRKGTQISRKKIARNLEMDQFDELERLFAQDSEDEERGSVAFYRSDRSTGSNHSTASRTSNRSFRQWSNRAKEIEKQRLSGASTSASAMEELDLEQMFEEVTARPAPQFRELPPDIVQADKTPQKVSL